MPFRLIKEVRDLKRFSEILGVLFEEGFDTIIHDIRLLGRVPVAKRVTSKLRKREERSHEEKLRRTLERLGPTFVKFGQMLSVRPDLLPKSYIRELEKLQDQVPPFPYEQARKTVEKELGRPLESVFSSFEKKPIASASISQVHRAVLRSGEKVAVKVQRPGIIKTMASDIDLMMYFARLLQKNFPKIRQYEPVRIVEEFESWTKKELDFKLEAKNAVRFGHNFADDPTVKIPKVFLELSTVKVLVTEFIDGVQLYDLEGIRKMGVDFGKVLENGFNAVLRQVFEFGFFHADPHPGNIIVLKNGAVAFVDFGIIGHFDERLKNQAIDAMSGIVSQDADFVVDTLLEMGMDGDVDKGALRDEIKQIIDPLKYLSLHEEKLSSAVEDIINVAMEHHIRIPASFVLFGKTMVTLEGIALKYDPDFPIIEKARPYIERLVMKRYAPKEQLKGMMTEARRYKKFFQQLPAKATRAMETLERGKVDIHLEDTDISRLSREIEISSSRIAYGLVIAGLLVASSYLIQVEKGPFVYGIPLIAFATFFSAAVLGFLLLISILNDRYG